MFIAKAYSNTYNSSNSFIIFPKKNSSAVSESLDSVRRDLVVLLTQVQFAHFYKATGCVYMELIAQFLVHCL